MMIKIPVDEPGYKVMVEWVDVDGEGDWLRISKLTKVRNGRRPIWECEGISLPPRLVQEIALEIAEYYRRR